MKRTLSFLLLLAVAPILAADYDHTSWKSQLYVQVSPYDPLSMYGQGTKISDATFEAKGVPLTGGFLWNPLYNPLFKVDIPLSFWIGAELGSYRFGDMGSISGEKLSYQSYTPSAVGGLSINVYGDWDLRLMGGYGQQYFTFENSHNDSRYTSKVKQAFAGGVVEYRITELWDGVDLKVGLHARKQFLKMENVRAVKNFPEQVDAVTPVMNGLVFDKIETDLPVQVGIEFSFDFGRESRRDRKVRFKLGDRTVQLREHNKERDTLSEWDCMAIERDYKFFLEGSELPDVRHKFTKAQYSDVLESFLAFCKPENLRTREKLFASLDSNKVEVKRYQITQEDARYKQVMASNDVNMMKMFLQYYPETRFRSSVESKINVMEDYQDFKAARATNTFQSYLGYLSKEGGGYRKEAETGIFELVKAGNRVKDYEIYLKRFPDGIYVEDARRALHELNKVQGY